MLSKGQSTYTFSIVVLTTFIVEGDAHVDFEIKNCNNCNIQYIFKICMLNL